MSERFGDCKRCKGLGKLRDPITLRYENECPLCEGTGDDGSIEARYNTTMERAEREREDAWLNQHIREERKSNG